MSGLPRPCHALVTGGGRGIGRAIASALVQAGATVTVLGRNRTTLDDAVAAGDAHFAGVADVADQAAVNAAIAAAATRQPIDILIANAGIAESAPFAKSDAALFRRMLDVDFMGVVHAIKAVLPAMKDRRYGRIVAIASTAGLKGLCLCQRLQRGQACGSRACAFAGAGTGRYRRDRQCSVSRLHGHRPARRQHRQHHQEDWPQPRPGRSRPRQAQSARPPCDPCGSRRYRALAVRRGRRGNYRAGDRGGRRRGLRRVFASRGPGWAQN